MATININKREVVRRKRNGRADESTSFLASSSFATGGTIIDWAEVTPDLVTINRDLHVTGNITASKDVIAYVAGAVTSDVLDALTVSNPLTKAGTNISLKVNPAQLEVNASNELQIKAGVLVPSTHYQDINTINGLQTVLDNKIETSIKGSANGLAELDANGFVKNTQLPSYVDDVIDGQLMNSTTFDALQTPHNAGGTVTPEAGKIYLDIYTNLTYRWSGTLFSVTNSSLALGETSTTAYRGDRGKTAFDHSQVIHDKNLVGLSNVNNTSDASKPVSTAQQTALNLKVDKVAGKSLVNDTDIAKLAPITVTTTKVTIDRDLEVTGNITASKDVVAYVAGAVTSDVLSALSVSQPLEKEGTNVKLNINPAQFSIVGNQLNYIGSTGLSSVSWSDVTSKPIFSAVATSGSYTDLSNKPTTLSTIATNDLGNYGGFALQTSISNINNTSDASKSVAYAANSGLLNSNPEVSFFRTGRGSLSIADINNFTIRESGSYIINENGFSSQLSVLRNAGGSSSALEIYSCYQGIYKVRSAIDSNRYSSWNTLYHDGNLNKSVIGLGNVDNTADSAKSVSYANSAGNATYAANSTKLYSTDGSYAYGAVNPYYGHITYNGASSRWRFQVSPATPAAVEVAFADLAGNADTLDGYHNGQITAGNVGYTSAVGQNDVTFLQFSGQNEAGDNPTGSWCSIMKLNHGNGDTYYNRTLAFDFFNNDIYTRYRVGGNASSWAKLWNSDNFNPDTKLSESGDYLNSGAYLGMNGGTSFGLGVLSQNRNSAVFDTIEAGGSDSLELNYYTGGEVHIGANGTKALRASNIYCLASEGREVSTYLPASYSTDDLVSGHMYKWYNDIWRAGATRSGGVGIGDYVITLNGVRKLALTTGGSLVASGEITAYSDIRLKSEIKPLTVRGDLNPVTYTKDGKESIGFIAQEVKEIYPELVIGDESKEMLSLNYQQLTAVLYAEILELKERIKRLEGENNNG